MRMTLNGKIFSDPLTGSTSYVAEQTPSWYRNESRAICWRLRRQNVGFSFDKSAEAAFEVRGGKM